MSESIITKTDEILKTIKKLNEGMYLAHDELKFNIRARKVGFKEIEQYKELVGKIQMEMTNLIGELNKLFLNLPVESIKKNDRP